jgi:hypothetical protein
VRKKKSSKPASKINIVGEGTDEWDHRFFKFAVAGSDIEIPPFSAKEIMENSTALFGALTDAGANIFQKSTRNDPSSSARCVPIPTQIQGGHSARLEEWGVCSSRQNYRPTQHYPGALVPALGSTTAGKVPGRGYGSRVAKQDWEALFRQFPPHVLCEPRPYRPHFAACRWFQIRWVSAVRVSRIRQDRRCHARWFYLGLPSVA